MKNLKTKEGKLKNKNGITLIALVVTIIVLLILAGISIAMLTGQNGILNRASEAKRVSGTAQTDEQVKIAVGGALAKGLGTISYNDLKEELDERFGAENYTITPTNDNTESWTVTITKPETREYTITKKGHITGLTTNTGSNTGTNTGTGGTTPTTTAVITGTELTALQQNGMAELTGSQITNSNINPSTNSNVRAVLTGQIPVPTGYTYVEGTATTESSAPIDYGVVIEDEDHNQWVWVPVNETESIAPSTAYDTISSTSIASRTKHPSVADLLNGTKIASLNGLNGLRIASSSSSSEEEPYEPDEPQEETVTKTVTKKSASGILEDIDRGSPDDTSSYREPALVTDYDTDPTYYKQAGNFNTAQEFADAMVKDYNDMITSITKYGGFYVGRYELSGTNNGAYSEIGSPKVQAGQDPIDTVNWYRLYQANRKFNKSSTTSTMIWGSQWDIVCLWARKVGNKVAYNSSDSSRHSNNYDAKTGSNSNDIRNNVYDLEGSRHEWTQEASNTDFRAVRGGNYNNSGSVSHRDFDGPDNSYGYNGSRPTLYIK